MGCGASKAEERVNVSNKPRKSIVLPPPPEIDLIRGPEVKPFPAPPASRVLVVFGEPLCPLQTLPLCSSGVEWFNRE